MNESHRELQDKYTKLRIIHDATNKAVESLTERNSVLEERCVFLEHQLDNANQNVSQQKMIVARHLADSAEKERGLVDEIIELKKRLKGG